MINCIFANSPQGNRHRFSIGINLPKAHHRVQCSVDIPALVQIFDKQFCHVHYTTEADFVCPLPTHSLTQFLLSISRIYLQQHEPTLKERKQEAARRHTKCDGIFYLPSDDIWAGGGRDDSDKPDQMAGKKGNALPLGKYVWLCRLLTWNDIRRR